jgi:SAM-dependent methyltransferase
VSAACPACGSAEAADPVWELAPVPIHSCLLVDDRAAALGFPRGRLELRFCRRCGFIWNAAFEPARMHYGADYEETQWWSPRFRRFQTDLVERLVGRYDLHGKDVVEIGCGKGEFLVELCERGGNRGIGFDPAYRDAGAGASPRVTFVRDWYSERTDVAADFLCCRHALEHVHDPGRLVGAVRRSVGDDRRRAVMFEVPDTARVLAEEAFWDLYYEHCSYFTPGSLGRLFRAHGFEILDLYRDYGDQYVLLEARPASGAVDAHPAEEPVDALAELVARFRDRIADRLGQWRERLAAARAAGRTAVLWGSGSKAVAYLTTMRVDAAIACVVDINPRKQGKFLAGTGHEIVAPERLRALHPDLVVVMNPIYRDEIQATLRRLDVRADVLAV